MDGRVGVAEQRLAHAEAGFLEGGGEMGALMRAHDWSHSTLGDPSRWPQSLRTVVRLMLNTGHPMYIWWGRDGACLYNDAYRESIGPERHPGSLGRPAREVWDEIWDIIGPQIRQVLEGRGATWHVNHLVPITRHGRREEVYWTYSYSPIDDATSEGGIGGVLVVCTETTEQVLASKRMAAELRQLGQLFQQSPMFMALLQGPEHRFEIANPAYVKLVGNREVLGKSVAEALPDTVEQGYLRLLDDVYASGQAYIAHGAKYLMQATPGDPGVERYVDFVYQPIKDVDGRVTGIFVEGADVTERALANSALRASEEKFRELSETLSETNRQKDEFLATLAHELRNPLAPIKNALALQRRAVDDPKVLTSTRDMMERQVAHLARLIDDLLDLSRLSRGRVELKRRRIRLAAALSNAVETSRPVIEQSGHELTISEPGEELLVDGDNTRIVQIFANLLNNAAKYTPRGGKLHLRLSRHAGDAVVSIKDNGIGIPADMLHRVFEMFTRVSSSHTQDAGGLGIGLTLVRQLVELHGGSVEANSAGIGLGSEFVVRLPLVHGPVADDESARAPRPARAAGLRILVADDNIDAAESLKAFLELGGHSVTSAHDGEKALALARETAPDVMVVDIAMPRRDGLSLARSVRAEPWGRRALLVAVSGWGQQADKLRSIDAGFDHHLVKPVDLESLDALLTAVSRTR